MSYKKLVLSIYEILDGCPSRRTDNEKLSDVTLSDYSLFFYSHCWIENLVLPIEHKQISQKLFKLWNFI